MLPVEVVRREARHQVGLQLLFGGQPSEDDARRDDKALSVLWVLLLVVIFVFIVAQRIVIAAVIDCLVLLLIRPAHLLGDLEHRLARRNRLVFEVDHRLLPV